MSFLTEIGNFAYDTARKVKNTVVEFFTGDNSDTQKVQNNKPNSVVKQTNPGSYTDEFVRNQSGGEAQAGQGQNANRESVKSVKQLFENRCMACGADKTKIEQLLNINSLNDEEKIKQYKALTESINLVISMKEQGRFDAKTDVEAWVAFGVQLKEEASLIPDNQKTELYKKHLSNIDELLSSIQNAKDEASVMKISEKKNDEINLEYLEIIQQVQTDKTLTLEKKGAKIAQLNNERRTLLKNLYLGVTAVTGDNRKLIKGIRLVDSDDMDKAIQMGRETRKGKLAKTAFSDAIKVKDYIDLTDSYNKSYKNMPGSDLLDFGGNNSGLRLQPCSCPTGGFGGSNRTRGNRGRGVQPYSCPTGGFGGSNDEVKGNFGGSGTRKVSPQSLGDAVAEGAGGKSAVGLASFEQDLVDLRGDVESSNDEYMKEITRAMHSGVGAGILLNTNLTEEQKTEFLTNWDNDARKFGSSYEQVTSGCKSIIKKYIQKYGKGNPELVKKLERLEKKLDEIIARKNREEKVKNQEAEKIEKEIKAEKKKIETAKKQKELPKDVDSEETEEISAHTAPSSKKYSSSPKTVSKHYSSTTASKNDKVSIPNSFTQFYETDSQPSSVITQRIIAKGYNSVPAGVTRLKATLKNPTLRQLYLNKTPEDFKTVQSVEEILPTLNSCPTSVRIFAVEHVNPNIKDELIAKLKRISSQDFAIIMDARTSKDEKTEQNAAA